MVFISCENEQHNILVFKIYYCVNFDSIQKYTMTHLWLVNLFNPGKWSLDLKSERKIFSLVWLILAVYTKVYRSVKIFLIVSLNGSVCTHNRSIVNWYHFRVPFQKKCHYWNNITQNHDTNCFPTNNRS